MMEGQITGTFQNLYLCIHWSSAQHFDVETECLIRTQGIFGNENVVMIKIGRVTTAILQLHNFPTLPRQRNGQIKNINVWRLAYGVVLLLYINNMKAKGITNR